MQDARRISWKPHILLLTGRENEYKLEVHEWNGVPGSARDIANPDAIDNNALELMKTGVLSPADYSAFMERFDSNRTMLKLVGHYAAEAAKTTDSRREAATLNAIALECQSGEGAVMRAWDSLSAISDSCGDGDGYRRKSPGVIVSMSEKWDDLAGEAVENF